MATDESVQRITTPAGDPAWMVIGYREVRALLGDVRLDRLHPDPGKALRYAQPTIVEQPAVDPASEQAHSVRIRRLLGRVLSSRRVEALRPRLQVLVDGLLDDIESRARPVDFQEAVAVRLPALVVCELLGIPSEERDDYRRWSEDAGEAPDGEGGRKLRAYLRGLADRRRREPAGDFVSELVAGQQHEDALSNDEVAELGGLLRIAGHRNTVAIIRKGTWLLLLHEKQRQALQRDPSLIPRAVEEILRYPGHGERAYADEVPIPRYAHQDVEVGDVTIEAGEVVLLMPQAANGDASVFADPDQFDVCRTENPHLAFGYGPHFCLGAALIRMELEIVFSTLLRRFPTLRLAIPPAELRTRSRIGPGGFAELPVTW